MAATTDQTISSSMSQCAYHVFLSFRGKDTRKTFIDYLHTALEQAGIHSFRDDDEIEKGEDIESELRRAIQQSRVSVIVFSKNYAFSGWCLDELVNILERRKTSGQVVLPVFYDADPAHVMNQTGTFGEAFARHEKEAELETDERKKEWMDRVKSWKEALVEVVNPGEKILQSNAYEHESLFIQEIVQEIGKKLNRTVFMVAQYPVGLDWRVEKINLWLEDGSSDAVIGVIHGMGGMGKTTIAKTIYNLNFERFKYRSFLADIREASKRPNGLVRLQTQLLEDILKGRKQKIRSVDDGIIKIKNAICGRKVFIVLDDVDQLDQLNAVFGMQDWLYPGSKVIITTRNETLIKARGTCKMFKVDQMDNNESFVLFCCHAFGKARPDEGYMELSLNALQYCGGVPLALQVLGSSLRGRSVAVWESALKKLKAIPNNHVLETLAVSFESLQDDLDKKLFLHIACFFVGKEKDYTVKVLDECELFPTVGIHSLVDRCLITIDDGRKLRMHQLIQDMAKEIIRKESPEEPGRRSFLCHEKDSLHVLTTKTGTDRIQGLILNRDMVMEENSPGTNFNVNNRKRHHVQDNPEGSILPYQGNPPKRHQIAFFSWQPIATALTKLFPVPGEVNLTADAFAMMHNLKLLKLNYVQVSGSYNEFPKEVRWLCWHGFALKYIPSDFPLESLVSLDMQKSSLKQVWKGTKSLRSLKFLNLSYSCSLTTTPDFSGLPSLERLALKYCTSLVKVHESIGDLGKLGYLNLRGCEKLRELPRGISCLKSLEKLILSDCSMLQRLPMELEKMESLNELHAGGTAVNQSLFVTGKGDLWPNLFWSRVPKPSKNVDLPLLSLPCTLVKLRLGECSLSDNIMPKDFSGLPSLLELDLSVNPITTLPDIKSLTMLKSLYLHSCTSLQSLPELPSSLKQIVINDCESLKRMVMAPGLLKSMSSKLLDGCNRLTNIDGLFKLELIGNFDAKITDKLGLVNLESMGTVEVELCNRLTSTRQKLPIQGLLEFGIFSTFLPGSRVPDSFSHKNTGSSTSFTVPWFFNLKILGLRLCVAYLHSDRHKDGRFYEFYLKITNNTKGLQWTYGPTFYGNEPEDILWVSHWSVRNQFQGGDEVNVSMVVGYGFQVRELGIDILYDQEQSSSQSDGKQEVIQRRSCSVYENVLDGDLSLYQLDEGVYVLCHHDLYHPFYSSEDFSDDELCGEPAENDPSIWPPIFSTDEEEGDEEYEDSDEDF